MIVLVLSQAGQLPPARRQRGSRRAEAPPRLQACARACSTAALMHGLCGTHQLCPKSSCLPCSPRFGLGPCLELSDEEKELQV